MKKAACTLFILLSALVCAGCGNTEQKKAPESEVITSDPFQIGDTKEDVQDDHGSVSDSSFDFESKTVTLNSGYKMPLNGIGTYSLLDEECVNAVSEVLSRGVRLIDTAYMYHNEENVGEAVRSSGIPREEIFVITKLYPSQFAEPEASINEALEKLDIGYIDLMLLHHPGDGDVKAYKAMEKEVEEGKIRSIGLSKMEQFFSVYNVY